MNSKDIDKPVEDVWALERSEATSVGSLGFTARVLALATMPHRQVNGNEYERRNGSFVLSMVAPSKIGLPWGSYPRLIVAWMTTEVQRTRERTLVLGPSLGGFMRDLGITPSAGRWGTKTRVRDQLRRLFACSISGHFTTASRDGGLNFQIAESYDLWWDPQTEDQAALWQSTVTLGERFYRELLEHPVPISLDALRALRRSPLALDIYVWLTHRMSYLNEATSIPWVVLQTQFGADYANTPQGNRHFRYEFKRQLRRVLDHYRGVSVRASTSSLVLRPSDTHVPKRLPVNKPAD